MFVMTISSNIGSDINVFLAKYSVLIGLF